MPANYNRKFIEAFEGFEDYYVLIGGTATSIVLEQNGLESRRTPDYDMVLTKNRTDEFYKVFTQFIHEGEYVPQVMDRDSKLYRFKTENTEYPKIIELFCDEPPFPLKRPGRTIPVHFAEKMSLSALLLDKEYYQLLLDGKTIIQGYSVLKDKYLIVFKAKAWIDLTERKEQGEHVDSKNIKKHLNDIARLAGAIEDIEKIPLLPKIQSDMQRFITELAARIDELPDRKKNKDIVLDKEKNFAILSNLFST